MNAFLYRIIIFLCVGTKCRSLTFLSCVRATEYRVTHSAWAISVPFRTSASEVDTTRGQGGSEKENSGYTMRRVKKTLIDETGLSRQSSRSYNTVCRKWSTSLEKTLRKLDVEHESNISKILNERFDVKIAHHALRSESDSIAKRDKAPEGLPGLNFAASECFVECASQEMAKPEKSETPSDVAKLESGLNNAKQLEVPHKALGGQIFCRLPSITEETFNRRRPPRSPKSDRWLLPPLPPDVLPNRSRRPSDRHPEKSHVRTRQRSSTLPTDLSIEDRWRNSHSPFSSSSDSGALRKAKRAQDDDARPAEVLPSTWPTDLEKCRYLRRRSATSPDVLDVEAIFRN